MDLTSHTRLPLPPSARTTGALAQDLALSLFTLQATASKTQLKES